MLNTKPDPEPVIKALAALNGLHPNSDDWRHHDKKQERAGLDVALVAPTKAKVRIFPSPDLVMI